MPYVKNVWVDEELTEDPHYNILDEEDVAIHENVKIELETPVVTPGTALTADRMNNIEEGIETLDEDVTNLSDYVASVETNTNTALSAVNAHFSLLELGWIAMPGTMSYSSADAPSFVASVNMDVTSFLSVGDKVWLTQTTSKYFIVTAIGAFSGGACLITLYGGSGAGNYTLANAAITNPHFSKMRTPFGFPLVRDIWDINVVHAVNAAKSTGLASSTWYGGSAMSPAGPSIALPIGMWGVQYEIISQFDLTLGAMGSVGGRTSLSTSESAESDPELTANYVYTAPAGTVTQRVTAARSKIITLAAKATYYGVVLLGATPTSLSFTCATVFRSTIRARCEYL